MTFSLPSFSLSTTRNSGDHIYVGITELAPAQRLQTVLSRGHSTRIRLLKISNGKYTNSHKECICVTFRTHFPGCKTVEAEE